MNLFVIRKKHFKNQINVKIFKNVQFFSQQSSKMNKVGQKWAKNISALQKFHEKHQGFKKIRTAVINKIQIWPLSLGPKS